MSGRPIAVQLYSVRKECERDLPATLAAVAKMGYQGVEFAGYHNRSAAELRTMLSDLGLKVVGTHLGLDQLQGDELKRTIDFNHELGNKYLIIAWMDPEKVQTRAGLAEFARALNEVSDKLKPHGMQTGYHNHSHEFKPLDGETAWDVLATSTKPEVVMQLDLGNAAAGGADPLAALRRWANRGFTIHLKEHSTTKEEPLIGEGDVPWADVFRACDAAGKTEWYIVEQESYPYPPLDCVERCLKNLRPFLK